MKKTFSLLLALALLCPASVSAAEKPKFLALAFEGCPSQELLDELADRHIRATCFLRAEDCHKGRQLRDLGHEIGILSDISPTLSRREMARQIGDIRDRLPENCPVPLLLHRGSVTPGLRQVADALGMELLQPAPDRAEGGELWLLDAQAAPDRTLGKIDRLRRLGFTLVTVSALSRIREIGH